MRKKKWTDIGMARGHRLGERYEDSCINHAVKEEKMETKTRKERAASHIFDETLFAMPDKHIVDPSSKFLLTAFHELAFIDDGVIFEEERTTRNFKYVQRHKTRPLTISNG